MRLAPAIAGNVDALSRQPTVFAVVASGSGGIQRGLALQRATMASSQAAPNAPKNGT